MSEAIRDKSDLNIAYADQVAPERAVASASQQSRLPSWVQRYELRDLPRLPIPSLEQTVERYLNTVQSLLSEAELDETRRKASDFLSDEGDMGARALNAELQELARRSPTSWLEGFWDTMYLEWRQPIPIHINPCFVLQDDPTPSRNGQVQRAASLIAASLWFVDQLRRGHLSADSERDVRLCMHQYTRLFGSTRIPGYGRDRIVTDYASRHIAVVARDRYYAVDVFDEQGRALEIEILERVVAHVLHDAQRGKPVPPVGMLTTMGREEWAASYAALLDASPQNRTQLAKLSNALLLVCLDEHIPASAPEMARIALHADGRNRWFDKSLQLIVCANGKAAINMEHSPIDGHTCLRYAEDFFHYAVRTRCDSDAAFSSSDAADATSGDVAPLVHSLELTLTPALLADIERATVEFGKLVRSCESQIVHYTQYGKHFCTRQQLSPDAVCQMAFQLTFHRLHGRLASVYESALTKRFYHGRTECLRALTPQCAAFVQLCAGSGGTAIEQLKALRVACEAHTRKAREAKANEGVDRHLTGLLNLARMRQRALPGCELPELFKDVAWAHMRHDSLSTSNCGGYSLASFGFGPVVPDGYGVGYIIKDKCMHFHLSSFVHGQAKAYAQALEQTFNDLAQLLVYGTPLRLHEGKSKL